MDTSSILTKPIYRYSPDDRRRLARAFLGVDVRVVVRPGRTADSERIEEGRVVAVAIASVGTVADFVVLANPGVYERAISLATVASIESKSAS